jgi:hypothetical protein
VVPPPADQPISRSAAPLSEARPRRARRHPPGKPRTRSAPDSQTRTLSSLPLLLPTRRRRLPLPPLMPTRRGLPPRPPARLRDALWHIRHYPPFLVIGKRQFEIAFGISHMIRPIIARHLPKRIMNESTSSGGSNKTPSMVWLK